jgi:hypothetical protein
VGDNDEDSAAVARLLIAEETPGRSREEEVEIVAAVASVTGDTPAPSKVPEEAVAAPPAPKSPGIVFVPPRYAVRSRYFSVNFLH